jgi:hypothetical protein
LIGAGILTASFAHLLCPFLTEEANDEWREATT